MVLLDGGDVVDTGQHVDLSNLHWAAGVGLRLFTLVGAVRLEATVQLPLADPEVGAVQA